MGSLSQFEINEIDRLNRDASTANQQLREAINEANRHLPHIRVRYSSITGAYFHWIAVREVERLARHLEHLYGMRYVGSPAKLYPTREELKYLLRYLESCKSMIDGRELTEDTVFIPLGRDAIARLRILVCRDEGSYTSAHEVEVFVR